MPALMKRFLGTSEPEPIKFAMQPIQERTEESLFVPVALVWVMGRNKAKVVDGPELYNYLTERKTSLVLIQEFMTFEGKTHSSTSIETFVCEFRENKGIRNFMFSKRFKLFEEKTDNPHSEMYKPEYWKLKIRKGKVQTIENKSLDKRLNDAVEENMTKIMSIIEKKGCKIMKAIGKFLVDDHGNCFFKGLDEVFIERRENLSEEMDLEELMLMKRPIIKEKAMVRVRKNVKGVYSLNLRKSLMEERCEGDFCDFVGLKMIKGGLEELPSSKYLTEEQRSNFNRNKELLFENYNISNLLLKKIYANKPFVAEILFENSIFPKDYTPGSPGALELKENHLLNKKNLIKFVKICSNCFYIYNFLHEKLASRERKEQNLLRTSSGWLHREKRFSHTFNDSLKVRSLKNTKTELNGSNEEYSFLKKQTVGSHVLNLGFTSSFRTTFRVEKEENQENASNLPTPRVNLYETFAGPNPNDTNVNISAILRKKTSQPELNRELSRKSSSEVMKLLSSPLSGTNLKQKRESIQQVISSRKIQQAKPSIQIKKRMSTMPSYLRHSYMSKQSLPFKSSDISSRSIGIYHRNPQLLRQLPSFRISTPKLSLVDGLNPYLDYREPVSMDFPQLLTLLNANPPEIEPRMIGKIQVFVCDENTAIPYILLNNKLTKENPHKHEINREVLVVVLDFFDNFMTFLDFFQTFLLKSSENLHILLFNYPGQAYTYFSPSSIYNNSYNATLLDLLLFDLQRNSEILLRSDNFRLLGFGNGANILSFFLTLHDHSIVNFKQCLLFNPFLYVDDMLSDILNKSIEVFQKFPLDEPEMCLIFEETFNRQMTGAPDFSKLKSRHARNPITIEGRLSVLKGTLENENISQNVGKVKTSIRVIFSQRNPLVNVTHLDLVLKNEEFTEKKVEFFRKFVRENRELRSWFSLKDSRLALILEEGGYNLMEDQKALVEELVKAFLSVQLKKNYTQRIALLEIKISRLEKKIVDFFLKFVEKLIEFTEDPFDGVSVLSKLQTIFDVYREKFDRITKENDENTNEFEWIQEEYRLCREKIQKHHEEYDEFLERNEKTLNIQTKKLADLKANLGRITSEFMNPFRISMRGLMFFKLLGDIKAGITKSKETFNNFQGKIQDFEGNLEDNVMMASEQDRKDLSNSPKQKEPPMVMSMDRRLSLEKQLKGAKGNKEGFLGRKGLVMAKRKIVGFFRNCFERFIYLYEVKNEVMENFSDASENFAGLPEKVEREFRGFFSEVIEYETKMVDNLKNKNADMSLIEDLLEGFRGMFEGLEKFLTDFDCLKTENTVMFDGFEEKPTSFKHDKSRSHAEILSPNEDREEIPEVDSNQEKQYTSEKDEWQESMAYIMSETNFSEPTSWLNLGSIKNMGKHGKKYKEGGKTQKFKEFYYKALVRKWDDDEKMLQEAELRGETLK